MLNVFFNAMDWILVAFALGCIVAMVILFLVDRYHQKRVRQQLVMGPYRFNIRRVM